jgi:hypothetical protein
MREMAIFYAAFVQRGSDGKYHIVPTMQQECWGFYPGLSRNRDCIAALSLFRWAFRRATEAARHLGRDGDLWPHWMEIADNLAPYPTWEHKEGTIFAALPGVEPWRGPGDHPWDVGTYPTLLADDITLDSDERTKDIMARTARVLPSAATNETLVLLGRVNDTGISEANTLNATTQSRRPRDLALGGGPSPERLLNSRSGRIHLFPCVASGTVAFRRFRARGAFVVSACRDESGVTFVEIEARRNLPCHLMNPWPGQPVEVREGASVVSHVIDGARGECLVFPATRGNRYHVRRSRSA